MAARFISITGEQKGIGLKTYPLFGVLTVTRFFYYAGRVLQLIGLLAMPSSIWIAEFRHSERGAISVFLGSIAVFILGWLLARIR